ncbi:MAG: protein translocase subunit SecDF [Flavobacteriaceae bacterium]|nr:protein translocase subunit SecDF [Flavobacteriaceae bacterium]
MQNKGIVKLFAFLFVAVSVYQLSFTYIANKVENDAAAFVGEVANADELEKKYLDSVGGESVIAGITYDYAKKRVLNKGLDLKGGVNVTLQISTKDILRGLANNSKNPVFNQALAKADKMQTNSDDTYLELFFTAFDDVNANGGTPTPLASTDIFANKSLDGTVSATMTNKEVQSILERKLDESIESAFEVIRKRIDKFGVTQPNIQREGKSARILVELPGAKDVERVKKLLSGTAQLEFYETHTFSEAAQYLIAVNSKLKEELAAKNVTTDTKEEEASADDLLGAENDSIKKANEPNPLFDVMQLNPYGFQGQNVRQLAFAKVGDTAKINGFLNGTKNLRTGVIKNAKYRWGILFSARDKAGFGIAEDDINKYVPLYALKSDREGAPAMLGDVLTDARQQYTQVGDAAVGLSMNSLGAKQWEELTGNVAKQGNAIAIVLDDVVYSAPGASQAISGGQTEISGSFTLNEAKDLANVLRAGKLPASADIIASAEVGPSLGQDAIDSGQMSFMLALLMVFVWMIFYYGKAGLYANIALALNILLIFGILAGLGAVLTLPGIAGIILTIGMSVDANVLIFERIKEELALGKSQAEAIKDGFSNALSSILDANVTTLLTAIILFIFGTGPIQGFATTLIIGIMTSLFTAIFITRLLVDWSASKGAVLPFSTGATKNIMKNMAIDFLGKRKLMYIISGVIVLASLASLFTNGLNEGIDFVGGRTFQVKFDKNVNTTEVSEKLTKVLGSVGVKTYGGDDQLKISTKYKIAEKGLAVDAEIKELLYKQLKSMLPAGMTFEQFKKGENGQGIVSTMKVGPTIADDIKKDSLLAVFGSLIVVFLYILMRFKWWQFSLGAVAAVFHDVIIVLGIFSLTKGLDLGFTMEIDQAFIAAILTVIGYSLNDTVVVFDRIREYFNNHEDWPYAKTVNQALNSTLSRTLNTSITTLIVLGTIFILGSESIRGFIFALIIGVIVGTYSSLFIATPVMFDTVGNKELKRDKKEEEETEEEVVAA